MYIRFNMLYIATLSFIAFNSSVYFTNIKETEI